MATTIGGLPYPLPSAPVANGAADIRALAEAVDARVPFRAALGTFAFTPPGAAGGITTAVTFPASRFTIAPIVATGIESSGYMAGSLGNVTTSGFSARSYTLIGTPTGGIFRWAAFQMTTAASGGLFEVSGDTAILTCHITGCANAEIPIELIIDPLASGAACGVCGQPITDIVGGVFSANG